MAQTFYNATREVCRHYAKNAPKTPVKVLLQNNTPHEVEYIIDGTNILHCHQKPTLTRVLALADEFTRRSIPFCVFFDASTPHRYLANEQELKIYKHLIENDPEHFCVAPARTKADIFILQYAKLDSRRRIITQDCYSEYENKPGGKHGFDCAMHVRER